MFSLAAETSTSVGSLALFFAENGESKSGAPSWKLLDQKTWSREGSHSESITRALEELKRGHGVELHKLNNICVGRGPGSFTGLRVALNFARALAYSTSRPILQSDSLRLLAAQLDIDHPDVQVWQYAFRDLVYVARYRTFRNALPEEISPPRAVTFSELEKLVTGPTIVLGSCWEKVTSGPSSHLPSMMRELVTRTPKARDYPLAQDFLRFLNAPTEDNLTDWIHAIPLYIRASEAEEKLKADALRRK